MDESGRDDSKCSVGHLPAGKWAFDEQVTDCFDDMLERSIPQYNIMRKSCFDFAALYRQSSTDIVDLGCSRGEAMAPLVERFGPNNRFIGLEVSVPMLEACRRRFRELIDRGVVDIRDWDLRGKYPSVSASVTLAVLTLQFVPMEYRQRIVRDVFKSTTPGGAFILVEKVLGETAELDRGMVDIYYAMKNGAGYSEEEIRRKRLSLEGVLVPVTSRWNVELLKSAGFDQVDCFWRWMNFAGWVAVKE